MFSFFLFRPSGSMKGHGEDTFFAPTPAIPQSSFQLMGYVTRLCAGFLATASVSLRAGSQCPGCTGWHVSLTQPYADGAWLFSAVGVCIFLKWGLSLSFIPCPLYTVAGTGYTIRENSARELIFPMPASTPRGKFTVPPGWLSELSMSIAVKVTYHTPS